MAESKFELSLSDINALFKIKYEKLSENVYNSANVLLGRVKKSYNFTGRKLQISIPQSFAGGVGSGKLPTASAARYAAAEIEAKKVYAVVDIDRETIKASLSSEGAFVKATKEVVKKGVESYMRNMSRILFSDSTGKIAQVKASGTVTQSLNKDGDVVKENGSTVSSPPSDTDIASTKVLLDAASFKEADVEERDLINVVSGASISSTSTVKQSGSADVLLLIDEVDITPASPSISILGDVETHFAANDSIILQGSLNKDPMGLKKALLPNTGSGSLFGVKNGRRWSAEEIDMSSRASQEITTDLMNEMMLAVKKKCGKSPNLIITSYKQYEKILNLMELKKQFNVNTRAGLKSKSGADISFSGIEFMSIDGAVGIFPERFVDDDRIYFLNDSHIHIYHRPDFGWFDDDGTVFLRKAGHDEYEARYGGYLEVYVNPCFHGVVKGLA